MKHLTSNLQMGCVSQFILLLLFIKRMSLTLSFAIFLVENFLRCHLLGCLSVTQTNCQPHLDCHFVIHWPVVSQVHCISVDERCKKLKCHHQPPIPKSEKCAEQCANWRRDRVCTSLKNLGQTVTAARPAKLLRVSPALHNFHSLSATIFDYAGSFPNM